MIAYENNELIPSSEFAKKFGSYLAQIKSNTVKKLAVLKNNRIEAVLVSKDEYEKMKKALEYQEFAHLTRQITESLDELELIKRGEQKAHKIDTLWDSI
jgi:PHD/YefM family antitoxin component YafN of YafNO toxin-antitoxin module